MTSRREFLQTTASISGALVLPRSLFGQISNDSSQLNQGFVFIQTNTLDAWSVSDPIQWCLENKNNPILKRASEGLANLSMDDGERIIRLVTRRCRVNLIEVQPHVLTVHYWSDRADLKPFFKSNGLAKPHVSVLVRNRKKEVATKRLATIFFMESHSILDSR